MAVHDPRCPPLPGVTTGTDSTPEYEERSRQIGAFEYLEKPFDLRTLETCVQCIQDHCELLRQIHRLRRELASAHEAASAVSLLTVWPIACVADDGELLYGTPEASAVLDAVVDPALQRPIERLDPPLLERLQRALPAGDELGHTTVFRRDGVVSHYTAFLRRVVWKQRPAILAFFLDAICEPSHTMDDLWVDVFRKGAGLPDVSDV